MRLFDEGDSPIPLTLISSHTFETGVLNLVYAPPTLPATPATGRLRLNGAPRGGAYAGDGRRRRRQ